MAQSVSDRMMAAADAGCEESKLLMNRRAMMGLTAGFFTWGFMPKSAEAGANQDRRLLIVLLRGGLDGMHVAYNASEQTQLGNYRTSMLASDYLTRNYTTLGSGFKINKALSKFKTMFSAGEAALIHAIAPPLQSRSHFDCMANVESGQVGLKNIGNQGWLNRFVAGVAEGVPLKSPLAMGGLPLILQGNAPVQSWGPVALWNFESDFSERLVTKYNAARPSWGAALRSGLDTNALAAGGASSSSSLVQTFSGAATLMSAATGPRIGVITVEGLDTHASQVSLLDALLANFDNGLDTFRTKMRAAGQWNSTAVVCVTEFGRTMHDRLTGTDHGTGTVAFLAGGNIQGNRVITDWPGISETALRDSRDLRATTDTRSLFKGLLTEHLGCANTKFLNETVFPGSVDVPALSGLVVNSPGNLSMKNAI